MRKEARIARTFTLEPEVSDYVSRTKGPRSASARVNQMLRRTILAEQSERLEAEAQTFFSGAPAGERREARAFQKAALRTLAKD